ncbi:GH3 family acyl-acid amido synthetase [Robertkochia flava]|uniref:GH3 family domain-containing protein n=1 Tax=Robertkochia flava TaxID=3447986 RepID=UPI001CCD1427|nr:GH3 auxin-responsive promoter family protein [Robertkochia marina]
MAILGHIIKGYLELREQVTALPDPVEEQRKVLKMLLDTARDTAFGKAYGFGEILEADDMQAAFSEALPYFDYNMIHQEWWYRLHEGEENITWPGAPEYYALSSGTTGNESKRIPVTREMLDAITEAGKQQVYAMTHFEMSPDFFEKEILMLGSSTNLDTRDGHKEGEISGISADNIPFWFRGFYKPGEAIASIDDWDERVKRIAEKAKEWDIGAISGIPSWIQLMLEKVIDHNGLDNIHDIWPNLQVYTSGGVAFEPYRKNFESLMGKPVEVIDTYLASEGFIALQERPETTAMKLLTDNGIYFEFVPFLPEYIKEDGSVSQDAPALNIAEVEAQTEYILIISTVSGLWRYSIGDTIKFTDLKRKEIRITGRTKFFLNVVGSQLSVNKLDQAIQHLEETLDKGILEYTICAKEFEDGFYHCWYLGSETTEDEGTLAEILDSHLQQANKNYGVARNKALKGVKVKVVSPEVFYRWNERSKKKGGQVKMERVMNEEKFEEWERFVNGEADTD